MDSILFINGRYAQDPLSYCCFNRHFGHVVADWGI
jgi:hypothetical protein